MPEEFEEELQQKIEAVRPADRASMDAAKAHWKTVGKPLNSLGKLEDAGSADCRYKRNSGLYDQEKRSCHHVCRQWRSG